ncbi:MAG: class I SAM-dependent RNA methyltransferase [Candidatus Omnitrophica bacterium]|nr:class I SAM-dependent RNA methyltransferase [Candidatus Omnitrophota bacterium]
MSLALTSELPVCPVFGQCGGCQHQNISYEEELRLKGEALKGLLQAHVGELAFDFLPIVPSPKIYHYRNRLDLRLKKTRDGVIRVGFSTGGRGPVLEIDHCPIAIEAISSFIPQLKQEAGSALPPKYKIANLTVRCGEGEVVRWGGIGRRSLRLDPEDYFVTHLCGLEIFFSLDTFFQANLSVLPKVMETLRHMPIWSKDATFFDLYGGVGLFGLCVHDKVRRVVNIEENVHAVKLARHNLEVNKLSHIELYEGKVEVFLPGILKKESFEDNILMVDPPRAGLSPKSIDLLNGLSRVKHLIYLSCNPETLAADLKNLISGPWKIVSIQPFDFFPRTRHLETLVLLTHF